MFQRIPKAVIVGLVVLINLLILVFGGIVLLRVNNKLNYKLSNIPFAGNILQNQQNSSGKIELVSEFSNYYLSRGHGFDNLVKLIENRGIFDKGLYVNKDSRYYPVGKIKIVLSKTELKSLRTEWIDKGVLIATTSADFDYGEDKSLFLKIYISQSSVFGLSDVNRRDKLFGDELIRLIFLATAPPSAGDSKVRVYSDRDAQDAISRDFENNTPIKISNK